MTTSETEIDAILDELIWFHIKYFYREHTSMIGTDGFNKAKAALLAREQTIRNEVVDSVIASLPEKKDYNPLSTSAVTNADIAGYNSALSEVTTTLVQMKGAVMIQE